MELFKGIDLNDSFVLFWKVQPRELRFDLELSIWPSSEYYVKPKEGEYTCYRKAHLTFHNCEEINGILDISQVKPSTDANGEVDYGNIDTLVKTDNGYSVYGDFGNVAIVGGKMELEVIKI